MTALQTLNNDVLPFFEEQGCCVEMILSDSREFCRRPDHAYELFLQLGEIEPRTTPGYQKRRKGSEEAGGLGRTGGAGVRPIPSLYTARRHRPQHHR